MHPSKSFSREKSTQDQKVSFIKEDVLKLTQVELLSHILILSAYVFIYSRMKYHILQPLEQKNMFL